MKKTFIYYAVAFVIAVTIGFFTSENQFYGFIIAMILFAVFSAVMSIFFGLFGANPMDKSPYEKRKKVVDENSKA